MKTKINIDFDSLQKEFDQLNELRKERNEFLELRKIGDTISLQILETGKEIVKLNDTFGNLFSYRDNYKCKIDFDTKELEVFTSTALHTHSEYSILDGANRLKDLASKYAYSGALTDHGVMYGFIDFYKKMKAVYKKPIIGFEAYTKNIDNEEKKHHLIILAKNDEGLKNAMKLCSAGNMHPSSGKVPRPIVSYEELKQYHEGLIVLSACIAGEVPQLIIEGNDEKLKSVIRFYKDTFGEDYYFEIQRHASKEEIQKAIDETNLGISVEDAIDEYGKIPKELYVYKYSKHIYRNVELYVCENLVNERILELSKKFGVKVVATTDAHYLNADDNYMHEALLCNQTKTVLSNSDRFRFAGTNYHVHTISEMEKLYHDLPETLINTLEIEDKCDVTVEFGNYKLPKFPIPEGYTDKTYLEKLVWDGFEERFGKNVQEFKNIICESDTEIAKKEYKERKERIRFELDTVFRMGYQGYFFIVWDYVQYAKSHGIYLGPGRGCVNEETLLYTETGLKKICEIEKGEKVYTHDGTLKTVIATHKYQTKEEEKLIKPRVYYGDNIGNAYTENHKVLAVKTMKETDKNKLAQGYKFKSSIDLEPKWIKVKDLEVGDLLVVPKFDTVKKESIRTIDLANYVDDRYEVTADKIIEKLKPNNYSTLSIRTIAKKSKMCKKSVAKILYGETVKEKTLKKLINYLETINLTIDEWRTAYFDWEKTDYKEINRFIKIDNDLMFILGLMTGDGWVRNRGGEVGVCFHIGEDTPKIIAKLNNVFGIKFKANKIYEKNPNLIQYRSSSTLIKKFLLSFWKGYNYTAQTKTFPNWIFDLNEDLKMSFIDGLWYADGSHKQKSSYSSTSWDLICKLKTLLTSLNIPNGLSFRLAHESKNAKATHSNDSWKIIVPHNFKNPKIEFNEIANDYVLKRIYAIEEDTADYVYDITVEDNHSYVTSNFVAHNSGAGSLVLYCLHITEKLDPLKYDLLFARFLNPDRISMPDIDLDFEYEYREQVINYCRKFYGPECVSRIITFGTMAAKGAIRDMARVLGFEPSFADMIAKLIPNEPKMTIQKAFKESKEFEELYDTNLDARKVINLAIKVEGLIKNTSQHACGVIISSEDISNFCPMTLATDEKTGITALTTQITMGECEEIGLLKFDFLGLRTESVIKQALADINRIYGLNLDNYDIPINDVNVYKYLSKGNTSGVFQLESDGMTSVITQLYQDVSERMEGMTEIEKERFGDELFERLVAGISLYRPGPMDEIPHYIEGMLDHTKVVYDTKLLESILSSTYGVLVYQEQVMLAVQVLAGFSQGQADTIRKAMGKKKQEILDEYKPYFIEGSGKNLDSHTGKPLGIKGCVVNGISREVAEIIWDKMYNFAKYAFNKSHGAAYAVVSAQTAWLAYYYPIIFMKANLNVYINNPDKLKMYLAFCTRSGIQILAPSVNESEEFFSLNENGTAIRFGLKGIKGLDVISRIIITERNERGTFTSLENFIHRMIKYQKISSGNLEALIYVGALDEFDGTRKEKIENLSRILEIQKAVSMVNQATIFDLAEEFKITNMDAVQHIELKNKEEMSKNDLLEKENEYSGFYISGHPLDDYKLVLDHSDLVHISSLVTDENSDTYVGSNIKIGGMIVNLEKKNTRKGGFLYTFTLRDMSGDINCVCFERSYQKNLGKIQEGSKVSIFGKFDENDFGPQFIVDTITYLDNVSENIVAIDLFSDKDLHTARNQYLELASLVPNDIGNIKLNFLRDGQIQPGIHKGKLSLEFFAQLQNIFGENACKLVYKA